MPPVEQESNAAPQPTRLPQVEDAQEGPQLDFPTRRISHSEDPAVRQPKNVIKLLGGEPLTAPIPQ